MTRKFVKPSVKGASVPHPGRFGTLLPEEGEEVEWDVYWARLEMSGDIKVKEIEVEPEPEAPKGPRKHT